MLSEASTKKITANLSTVRITCKPANASTIKVTRIERKIRLEISRRRRNFWRGKPIYHVKPSIGISKILRQIKHLHLYIGKKLIECSRMLSNGNYETTTIHNKISIYY